MLPNLQPAQGRFKGHFFKMTSKAQHENEAIKNTMLNRYKNLPKSH